MNANDDLDPLETDEWLDALRPVRAHSCIQRPPTSPAERWTMRSTIVRMPLTNLIQASPRLRNDSSMLAALAHRQFPVRCDSIRPRLRPLLACTGRLARPRPDPDPKAQHTWNCHS
jgi:hypothetical protein